MRLVTMNRTVVCALLLGGVLVATSGMAADKNQVRDPSSAECTADSDGDGVADRDCTNQVGDQVPDKDQDRDRSRDQDQDSNGGHGNGNGQDGGKGQGKK